MLLIYITKVTPRITYSFKQICTHILGLEIKFTSDIKEFVAHDGPKLSYGKEKLGNEIFIQNVDLLYKQGIHDLEIKVGQWEDVPCFFSVSEISSIPFDIFAASFYLLSRYEEYLPHVKNTEGRFPATESLGYKEGFLEKPVIDLWAMKFRHVLQAKFPSLVFKPRSYKVKNIIIVTQAYKYKKKGFARVLVGILRDLYKLNFSKLKMRLAILFNFKKDPFFVFEELIDFHKKTLIPFHFMFQLSDFSTHDRNLNYKRKFYKSLIKNVGDYCQIGLKLGFFAKDSLKTLKKEKYRLEGIINRPVLSAINNQYNLLLPDGYNNMAELEFREDYSMGYPEHMGFRAGTCTPFLFYDLNFEITTPLLIQSYIFNSKSITEPNFLILKNKIERFVAEVKEVGGVFGGIFSNENFASEEMKKQYFELLKTINEGAAN